MGERDASKHSVLKEVIFIFLIGICVVFVGFGICLSAWVQVIIYKQVNIVGLKHILFCF